MIEAPLRLKDVRKNELVWECESGQSTGWFIRSDPVVKDGMVTVLAERFDNSREQLLFEPEEPGAYGLRLYRQPQYATPLPRNGQYVPLERRRRQPEPRGFGALWSWLRSLL